MATLSSTLATIRQGTLEHIGEWYSGTCTANGAANGTTLIDTTNLSDFGDDKFNDWWVLLTSGTYSGQARRVLDFIQSTGTITVNIAFGGQVVSAVTYELCKYHPTRQVRWAINKALGLIFPNLHKQVVNDDLVAGNWLPNGGFEDWTVSTNPDMWAGGTGVTTRNTRLFTGTVSWYWGNYGLIVTRNGTDVSAYTSQAFWPPLADLFGKTVRMEGWTACATATRTRLTLTTLIGSTEVATTSSAYNTASLTQLLRTDEFSVSKMSDCDIITAAIQVNTGNTNAYWDNVRLMGPDCYVYALPLAFQNKTPEQVWIQTGSWAHGDERPCDDRGDTYPYQQLSGDAWKVEYDTTLGLWLLRLNTTLPIGYRMRLKGTEYIGTVTSDTDTVPLNPPQLNVLYPLAAQVLYESLARNTPDSGQKASYMGMAADCERDYNKARLAHGFARPKSQVDYGNWRY